MRSAILWGTSYVVRSKSVTSEVPSQQGSSLGSGTAFFLPSRSWFCLDPQVGLLEGPPWSQLAAKDTVKPVWFQAWICMLHVMKFKYSTPTEVLSCLCPVSCLLHQPQSGCCPTFAVTTELSEPALTNQVAFIQGHLGLFTHLFPQSSIANRRPLGCSVSEAFEPSAHLHSPGLLFHRMFSSSRFDILQNELHAAV